MSETKKSILYRSTGVPSPPLTCIAVHPQGRRLAVGTQDANVLMIGAKSGKPLLELKGHEALVSSLSFVENGSHLVSSSWDHTTRLWKSSDSSHKPAILKHESQAKTLATNATSNKGASGARDGVVKMFSLPSFKCIRNFQAHRVDVSGLTFTNDGSRLVTASWDGECKLWDTPNYELVKVLAKKKKRIRSMAVSPDGGKVYLGLHNGIILAITLDGSQQTTQLKGHDDIVSSLTVDPDGRRLLSASWDRSIRLWSVDSGTEESRVKLWTPVTSVAWDPKGTRFYSTHISGALVAWEP